MFAEYKRDVSHNYLILHGDETINTTSYQVRILTGNTMSSILKCRMQGLDGTWLFYYDITSKQSLASFYEQRKLQGEDLEMILKGFLHVIEEMAEFLLNTEQLVLCPEYIFLDVEKKEVSFCCLPDYHHPVQEQFRELTEYLLPKLDHEDPAAVNLGYGIYRKAMEPGMQLENIKELLYRSENSKEKIAESDTKIRDKEEYVEEIEEPPQFFQEEKKEKKDRKWQPAAGCAVGVLFLLGILIFRYLGYFPEIPIETVLGTAILLMGVGAGWTWMEEKKKKKRGLITFLILVVLVVLGVLAVYYQYMKKLQLQDTVHTPTTETEKLVAKDMDAGYPETPKEVIKLFGRINQCIYNKKLSDDDFSTLVGKLRVLYCESLQKKNSQDKMESEISAEKKKYPPKKRKIINYSIEDENKFQYKTIDGTEMVYLKFSYFVRTDNDYNTVNWYAILVKEDGKWRIREFNPLKSKKQNQ